MFVVVSGRATIEFEDGASIDVGPGDVCVLEEGARTVWTVHETLRKAYQITPPGRERVRRRPAGAVLARPRRTRRRPSRRCGRRDVPTARSSAAASPGCGPRSWPRQDDPARDVVLLEGDTVGFGGSGRNGGFVDASLTHGLANGLAASPRRSTSSSGSAPRTSRASRRRSSGTGSTAPSSGPACSPSPSSRTRSSELREAPSRAARLGDDAELLDRTAVRAEVDSPTYIGGALAAHRRRARRPGAAGVGPARARRSSWACGSTSTRPVHRLRERRRRRRR